MSGNPVKLHVTRSERGLHLLEYLAARLGVSRSQAKRLLDDRVVFVNGQRVWMARHPLEERDAIEVHRPAAPAAEAASEILFDDGRLVIIDKPAGMLSNGPDSIETALAEELGERGLRAVHRLDRETSGCLLFARDAKALEAMVGVFEERAVRKVYRAIVLGRYPARLGRIDKPLDHQEAVTRIRVRHAGERATEIEAEIETGRTHQIRRHVADAGFPVLGDKQYATRVLEDTAMRGIQRHMLHAWKLEFEHPLAGSKVAVEAALPEDYRRCLKRFGLSGTD